MKQPVSNAEHEPCRDHDRDESKPDADIAESEETVPKPVVNPKLTDGQRSQQREERLAAAEARLKKQGGPPKKKKATNSDEPLRGPNTQPLMRWTAG